MDETRSIEKKLASTPIPEPRIPAHLKVRFGVEGERALEDFSVNLSSGGMFLETQRLMPCRWTTWLCYGSISGATGCCPTGRCILCLCHKCCMVGGISCLVMKDCLCLVGFLFILTVVLKFGLALLCPGDEGR